MTYSPEVGIQMTNRSIRTSSPVSVSAALKLLFIILLFVFLFSSASTENYQSSKALTFVLLAADCLHSLVIQELKVILLLHTLQTALNRNIS